MQRFAVPVLVVTLALVGSATPAEAADGLRPVTLSRLAAEGESTATAPPLAAASYEVDVYAGMASGVLSKEFVSAAEEDVEVRLDAVVPRALEVVSIELPYLGAGHGLDFELSDIEPAAADRRGSRKRGRVADDRAVSPVRRLRSEPFTIPAGESATLRIGFRIAVPYTGNGFRLTLPAIGSAEKNAGAPPTPLSLTVNVRSEAPLREAASPSHDVIVDFVVDRTIVETVLPTVPGDRPFELVFKTGPAEQPTLAGYVGHSEDGVRKVEALLSPPEAPKDGTARPKQVLFVVDASGSMGKEEKLVQAREALSRCFGRLNAGDLTNTIAFGVQPRAMTPVSVDPLRFGAEVYDRWLEGLEASGGTRLLPALDLALSEPEDPERHRVVIVVTDGILEDEKDALALLDEKLGETRLFVVGVGQNMRQETLLRLAGRGRGAATFVGRSDQLGTAVSELFDSISDPLGWDLELSVEGVDIEEITPQRLPDLYAGRPVRVIATVRGDVPSAIEVRMSTLDGERRYRVSMPPRE